LAKLGSSGPDVSRQSRFSGSSSSRPSSAKMRA
jgi:hypothetical protein